MDMLSVLLSRSQMAVTLTMHIIFPTLNIGLALFLCIMEWKWLRTKNPVFLKICKFWTKLFSLAFGMGVVSGIVMAYELGTNFGKFTYAVGEVLGSLFVYEVLSAFFVEAGFLGIMLFGWNRVSPKMHFFATFMVMFGTAFSAFWIMAANSWMQTPAGYTLVEGGGYFLDSFAQAIFNPSFMHRMIHMVLASYTTCLFVLIGISAWYLVKKRELDIAKPVLSFALWAALIVVPVQMFVGDAVGLILDEYQPLKVAAMEGVWDTQRGAPLVLFAYPDEKLEKNLYEISIPYGASLLNTHSLDGEMLGLKSVDRKDRPEVVPTFFGFRIMVGIGLLFLFTALYALWLRKKGQLYDSTRFLKWCVLLTPLGFIATIAGWFVAETGRQPWVVYNMMRTADGASEIPADHVLITLCSFIVIYLFILSFFLYYFCKTIQKGPQPLLDRDQAEDHAFLYMTPPEQEK